MFKRFLVVILLFIGIGLRGADGWVEVTINSETGVVESRAGTGGSSSPTTQLRLQDENGSSPIASQHVRAVVDVDTLRRAEIRAVSSCSCLTRVCSIAHEMCMGLGMYLQTMGREKESTE